VRHSPFETLMFSVVFWTLCSWIPCLAYWQLTQNHRNTYHQNITSTTVIIRCFFYYYNHCVSSLRRYVTRVFHTVQTTAL